MTIRVDAYTADGMARGVLSRAGHLREALDASDDVLLERASWQAADDAGTASDRVRHDRGRRHRRGGHGRRPDDPGPRRLASGPPARPGRTSSTASCPTIPGFDPGRALTRPTGSFVVLRDVRMRRED